MLSAAALAAFFLAGSLHAQEPPANTGQPAQTEDSGHFHSPEGRRTGRSGIPDRLEIWRSGSRRQKDGSQDQDIPRDDTEPRE